MIQHKSFGLRAAHTQARQQKRKRVFITAAIFLLCFVMGYSAYRLGIHQTELIHEDMLNDINTRRSELSAYQRQVEELNHEKEIAKAESKTWEDRYNREIPTGSTKELYEILTKRLEEGVPAERLSFVIRHAQAAPKCLEKPISKKIPIGVPGAAAGKTTFFDGMLMIEGKGLAAKNQQGAKEFWFDPKNAISIELSHVTGKSHAVTGKLPFETLLQVGDKIYHINLRAGPRGYCFVSATECDYP